MTLCVARTILFDILQVNIDIIANNDRIISERSAGAEQIVAFALIGALNRSAVRKGPIVMDTPFGRLDRKHSENVLSFIPTMSE